MFGPHYSRDCRHCELFARAVILRNVALIQSQIPDMLPHQRQDLMPPLLQLRALCDSQRQRVEEWHSRNVEAGGLLIMPVDDSLAAVSALLDSVGVAETTQVVNNQVVAAP